MESLISEITGMRDKVNTITNQVENTGGQLKQQMESFLKVNQNILNIIFECLHNS